MRHDEDNLQIACVRWFSYAYPRFSSLLHHSPNGGRRNLREAARFKAMGTKAGFPDLFLAVPRGDMHGLFIEMKSERGRQTPEQRAWQLAAEGQEYRYAICRTIDEFISTVDGYLLNEEYE